MRRETLIAHLREGERRLGLGSVCAQAISEAVALITPVDPPSNTIRVRIAVAVGDDEGDAVLLAPEDEEEDGRIIQELIENFAGPVFATAFIEADIPRISTVQGRVAEEKQP